MLGWIFKKKGKAPEATPAVAAKRPAPIAATPAPAEDWPARLAQARGDDDSLLALTRAAGVPLQVRQAAVEALQGEAALKLAEREFRDHDRRVHQLAKRRLQARVAQRQAREQATRLIETARGLAQAVDVPVSRGVELDHAWAALDATLLEPAQRDEFAALSAQLAAQARQRTDLEFERKRWRGEALQAVQQLRSACTEAAAGTQPRSWLAGELTRARGVLQAQPPDDAAHRASITALADLQAALQTAQALDLHLAVLDRLLAPPAEAVAEADASAEGSAEASAESGLEPAAPPPSADDPRRDWQALAPLADAQLAALLQARHARWQQASEQVQHEHQAQRREAAREQAREHQRARSSERATALAEHIAQAETALDAGQLADAHRHLHAIDEALQGAEAPVDLRTRIAATQARLAQLRGWQHWAGGRARDELVLQAEALAAATVVAGADKEGGEAPSEADAEVARLSIRQRAEVIATLRERWKEIDRLGGAGGRALWLRFDAALKTADEPVAAHAAAQRAARETNLSARQQLLDGLDALAPATGAKAASALADAEPADDDEALAAEAAAPAEGATNARALATALDRFHVEWRKLGPLEHTVPRAARAALVERLQAAVQRLEAPLQAARRQARAERETLVARARALAGDDPGRGRELADRSRALQAEWQQHAKALPLARADEQALWADFKGAIDAAFAAREAIFNARVAEFEAHADERAALIERLQVRAEDSAATQRRTLAEVDAAWQRCGPAPRARAAALDADYRKAREALRQWLDQSAQRAWAATCDALDARLALCLARERSDADAAADPEAALPALPQPFESALRRRAERAQAGATETVPSVDELLLQVETAWDLPTPPAFEAARRERKLLAMKAALEGRRTEAPAALPPDAALALLLERAGLADGQQARLAAVLAAWRQRGPQRAA